MQVANNCFAIIHTEDLYLLALLEHNWAIDLCPHSTSFQTAVCTLGSVLTINNREAVTSHHIRSFICCLENLNS